MLQALIAYADRMGVGDDGITEAVKVRWAIRLSLSGQCVDLVPLLDYADDNRAQAKTFNRPFTSLNALNRGDKSHFLCDALDRMVLFQDKKQPKKAQGRQIQHLYFKSLLVEAIRCGTAEKWLSPVVTFLESSDLEKLHQLLEKSKARPTDNATFFVGGMNLLEEPILSEILGFWRSRQNKDSAIDTEEELNVCIATGRFTKTLYTTERIKGVPGGLATGTNLISFGNDSFCSFGLKQAQNAALSAPAELKIRAALNQLISESRSRGQIFEDAVFIHWARLPLEKDPVDILSNADEESIAHLFASVQTGKPVEGIKANNYFASTLSGNGSRIIVRDWIELTVSDLEQHIAQWFQDLSLISPNASQVKYDFKFLTLLLSLVRTKLNELPSSVSTQLFRAALNGRNSPLPDVVLAAAIRRQQLDPEDKIKPSRLALIKASLIRTRKAHNQMKPELNPESTDPAYNCGRLLATFDRLQYLALGSVNAGVIDRFYASASVTPSLVMGRLFRNAQFHLRKLGGGAAINIEKELETLAPLIGPQFPEILDLEAQGRFALGFYHQKADYRRRSLKKKEAALKAASPDVGAAQN